uniref:F-box associated domain-containing protein n=1 Tax=Aegilops tauschii TaxID=37682 RepID=R7WA64_AEGTA
MLGFLYNYRYTDEGAPYWTSHFRAAAALPPRVRRDRKHWRALDSRHGLVLFDTPESDGHLVVSDLVTGEHWKIDGHITFPDACNATVLCARDGCDHRDCHGGPFLVACVDSVVAGDRRITCAMFYSSVTGKWIDPIFVEQPNVIDARGHSAVLGNKVYVPCVKDGSVVEYNTRENKLSVIKAPFEVQDQKIELMGVEDGMLLFASVVKPRLYLWSMEAGPRGAAGRAQSRFIELGPLLPRPVLVDNTEVSAVGFAEGVGVIFIKTKVGLYTIHLKSKQSNQVHRGYINKVMPYMSFYTGGTDNCFQACTLSQISSSLSLAVRDDVVVLKMHSTEIFDVESLYSMHGLHFGPATWTGTQVLRLAKLHRMLGRKKAATDSDEDGENALTRGQRRSCFSAKLSAHA